MVSYPSSYAGAQIRLVAVDMDGTLLDDEKNFPPGLDELLDHLEQRGVVFVPASGRQVWTLIDMFPERPGLTFIGENGAIVMRDGREISSAPLDLATVRESVSLIRQYALPRQGANIAREDVGEGSQRDNFDVPVMSPRLRMRLWGALPAVISLRSRPRIGLICKTAAWIRGAHCANFRTIWALLRSRRLFSAMREMTCR